MVRRESIEQLQNMLNCETGATEGNETRTLKRWNYTIVKAVEYISPTIVICDDVRYAAELVCELDDSEPLACWMGFFTDLATNNDLNPHDKIGLTISRF